MKKPTLYIIAAALMLLAAPAARADTIGVVNIQRLMEDSEAGKNARTQLEQKFKAYQNELTKKEEQLQKEEQELSKQRSVLAKNVFEEKAQAFGKKATEFQKEFQSKKALFNTALQRSQDEMMKAILDILAEIAKEKNFTVVVPQSSLLYADPKTNVTDEALSRLNKKLPKLNVKFDK